MTQEDVWPFSTLFFRLEQDRQPHKLHVYAWVCAHMGRRSWAFVPPDSGICVIRLRPQGRPSPGLASGARAAQTEEALCPPVVVP